RCTAGRAASRPVHTPRVAAASIAARGQGQDADMSARPSSTAAAAVIGRSFGWALRMFIIALHLKSMYFASRETSEIPAQFRQLARTFSIVGQLIWISRRELRPGG